MYTLVENKNEDNLEKHKASLSSLMDKYSEEKSSKRRTMKSTRISQNVIKTAKEKRINANHETAGPYLHTYTHANARSILHILEQTHANLQEEREKCWNDITNKQQ